MPIVERETELKPQFELIMGNCKKKNAEMGGIPATPAASLIIE